MMQTLGRYYVQYFNYHYKRTGTLWEGRYKSTLVSTEQYLLTCMRYIELNPVRAGMVENPFDYRWSSYHCNGLGEASTLIRPRLEYHALGRTPEERQKYYQALFLNPLDKATLNEIREGPPIRVGCLEITSLSKLLKNNWRVGLHHEPKEGIENLAIILIQSKSIYSDPIDSDLL